MTTQLDRIEKKLDDALKQTATNTADIAWLKRGAGALGGIFSLLHAWILHRQG